MTATEIKTLNIAQLKMDEEYQRKVKLEHVNGIAANFQQHKVGTFEVSLREDGYYLVDGQHRYLALKKLGLEGFPVLCVVHTGLTRAEESDLCHGRNTVRGMHALDNFKMRVVAKHREPVAITKLLEAFGLRVAPASTAGCVRAVDALLRIYLKNGEHVLRETLSVLHAAWGTEHKAYDKSILNAVASVIAKYPARIERERLVVVLRVKSPFELINELRAAKQFGGGTTAYIARLYNARKKHGLLEEQPSAAE